MRKRINRHRKDSSSESSSDSPTESSSDSSRRQRKRCGKEVREVKQKRKKEKRTVPDERFDELLERLNPIFPTIKVSPSPHSDWILLHSDIQHLIRDLLDKLACRWSEWDFPIDISPSSRNTVVTNQAQAQAQAHIL